MKHLHFCSSAAVDVWFERILKNSSTSNISKTEKKNDMNMPANNDLCISFFEEKNVTHVRWVTRISKNFAGQLLMNHADHEFAQNQK